MSQQHEPHDQPEPEPRAAKADPPAKTGVMNKWENAKKASWAKVWVLWLIFTLTMLLYTLTEAPSLAFGLLITALAGLYTWYLYRGGKIIILPWLVPIATLAVLVAFVTGSFSASSGSVVDLRAMSCKKYTSMNDMQRLSMVSKIHRELDHTGSTAVRQLSVQQLDYGCRFRPTSDVGDHIGD